MSLRQHAASPRSASYSASESPNDHLSASPAYVHDGSGSSKPTGAGRAPGTAPRPKFRRTKDGCLTCRRRRKRCDLAPGPECRTCQRLKLTCRWPETPIPVPLVSRSERGTSAQLLSNRGDLVHDSHPPQNQVLDPLGLLASALGVHESSSAAAMSSVSGAVPTLLNGGMNVSISEPEPVASQTVDLLQSFPFGDILGNFELDAATLQLWAADCLQPQPASGANLPITALGNGFGVRPSPAQEAAGGALAHSNSTGHTNLPELTLSSSAPAPAPAASTSVTSPTTTTLSPSASALRNGPRHADLLQYFQTTLSRLVTCSGDSGGFAAFTDLADRSTSLYFSILAWAGRHMANSGAARYEAISERLGAEAGVMVLAELEKVSQPGSAGAIDDEDGMTLLATGLMVMQFRICRGDVWGFDVLADRCGTLASSLYERVDSVNNVRAAQFLDNLIYHDVLSSFAYIRGPMVPYSLILKHAQGHLSALHTLTGVNLPVYAKMYRVIKLIRERRQQSSAAAAGGDVQSSWSSDGLLAVVGAAEQLEDELEAERERVEALVRAKPEMGIHRYYHEAFRTATLIQIRGFVLCESPCSLKLRLLVRQGLALLETMVERDLAGTCSIHWVIFIIGVMALPGGPGEINDRERVDKLYADYSKNIIGFLNVPRTKTLVHQVWARNQEGRAFVDWLDIVLEYDWELYFV